MPPHPGPASTFSLTSCSKYGIDNAVSSATVVVGARGGASASNDGKAADEDVVETEDDLDRVFNDMGGASSSAKAIDWYLCLQPDLFPQMSRGA